MDKYNKIIKILCNYKGINNEDIIEILNDKNLKYVLILLLKKYKCLSYIQKNNDFINYYCKKAKEKFLVNKDFRELYFEMDDRIADIK